jgi:hypothetical protein
MERAILVWQTLTQAQTEAILSVMLVVAFVSLGLGMFIGVKIAPQTGHQKRPGRAPQMSQQREMAPSQFNSLTPQVDTTRVRTRGYGEQYRQSQKYYGNHR